MLIPGTCININSAGGNAYSYLPGMYVALLCPYQGYINQVYFMGTVQSSSNNCTHR